MLADIAYLYTDGGLLMAHPAIGGTWAYVLLNRERGFLASDSGIVLGSQEPRPHLLHRTLCFTDVPIVKNDLTEMVAVWQGFCHLPDGWSGTVCTDSELTIERLTEIKPWNTIPAWLREEMHRHVRRLGSLEYILYAGHPTKADMARGYQVKESGRCLPVSEWNVLCDTLCNQEKTRWLSLKN
jgi:hypothetical protein